MKRALVSFILPSFLLLFGFCSRGTPWSARPGGEPPSLAGVDVAGIRFRTTPLELHALYPSIRCDHAGPGSEACGWAPRGSGFRVMGHAIGDLRCLFHLDSLRAIRIAYAEMLDVEYAVLDRELREAYGYAPLVEKPDSVLTSWRYDSLTVTLSPNGRPHWTGRVKTYTPVVELTRP